MHTSYDSKLFLVVANLVQLNLSKKCRMNQWTSALKYIPFYTEVWVLFQAIVGWSWFHGSIVLNRIMSKKVFSDLEEPFFLEKSIE